MPSIGPYSLANPYVLAPMAGVSEMPFRVLAFKMGAALCPTELVSAHGLMRTNQRTLRYLRHDPMVERPYSLQIFGGEPELMAQAAVVGKQWGAQIIDINMGCPVRKVTKSGAGSALLCDPQRAAAIVRAIAQATGLPVTAKIRSGWDQNCRNYLDVAEALEDAGCAALAIHPRTRVQGYSGSADWQVIADLQRHAYRMPIIGNGDVRSPDDARRMRESTGCALVMIGRAALGNPWIFRQLNGGSAPTVDERCQVVLRHFEEHLEFWCGVSDASSLATWGNEIAAVRSFRKHLGWYACGLRRASTFRAEVNQLELADQVRFAIRRFFSSAEAELGSRETAEVNYRAALG